MKTPWPQTTAVRTLTIPVKLLLHLGQQSRNALAQTTLLCSLLCCCCYSCVTDGDRWISIRQFLHQLNDGYPKAWTRIAAQWKCTLLPMQQNHIGVTVVSTGHRHFTVVLCRSDLLQRARTSSSGSGYCCNNVICVLTTKGLQLTSC